MRPVQSWMSTKRSLPVSRLSTIRPAARTFGPGSAEVVEAVNFNDPLQTVIAVRDQVISAYQEIMRMPI